MSSDAPSRGPRRSGKAWLILALVWVVGLGVWGLYLLLASMILSRASVPPPP